MGSSEQDEIVGEIARKLAEHLPKNALKDTPEEQLIAAMTYAARTRKNLQVVVGQVAAELYRRHRRDRGNPLGTWRGLAELIDMDHSTLYRWAQPYLDAGEQS